jgi:hypothetical protein
MTLKREKVKMNSVHIITDYYIICLNCSCNHNSSIRIVNAKCNDINRYPFVYEQFEAGLNYHININGWLIVFIYIL